MFIADVLHGLRLCLVYSRKIRKSGGATRMGWHVVRKGERVDFLSQRVADRTIYPASNWVRADGLEVRKIHQSFTGDVASGVLRGLGFAGIHTGESEDDSCVHLG